MKKKLISNGPLETKDIATRFKENLRNGDIILLKGKIGAGKSHFARSLIQAAMGKIEDVPSPTFTLVQTYYTTVGPIWHADPHSQSKSDVSDHWCNQIPVVALTRQGISRSVHLTIESGCNGNNTLLPS